MFERLRQHFRHPERYPLPAEGRGEWWNVATRREGDLYLATGFNIRRGLLRVDVVCERSETAYQALRKALGV